MTAPSCRLPLEAQTSPHHMTYCVQIVMWTHQSSRSGRVICWHRKWALNLAKAQRFGSWIPILWGVGSYEYSLASLSLSGLIYNITWASRGDPPRGSSWTPVQSRIGTQACLMPQPGSSLMKQILRFKTRANKSIHTQSPAPSHGLLTPDPHACLFWVSPARTVHSPPHPSTH